MQNITDTAQSDSDALRTRKQPARLGSTLGDTVFAWLARAAALLTLLVLVGIIGSLLAGAWPAIERFGLPFLWTADWDPVKNKFGGLVMIYGTLATSLIALLIAVPISFGIALFLTELSPKWLKRPLGTAIELLAAIPSIVYGMWGLLVFSPLLAQYVQTPMQEAFGEVPVLGGLVSGTPVGIGILSAGIILAIMIIPFIAAVMRDVFEVTPALLKESAYGLGSTTWEVMWRVVLPYTKTGVIGGIMLGLGRALGETMAVALVLSACGGPMQDGRRAMVRGVRPPPGRYQVCDQFIAPTSIRRSMWRSVPRASGSASISDASCSPGLASANSLASADVIELAASNSDSVSSWLKLPITNVTAIVSPSARPSPSMMPPMTPTFV